MEFDLSPLWISLKSAFAATVITFFLGIAAARWMIGYRGKGKGLIEGLFISPLVLPPTVVGFLLLLLFGKNGPIGQLLLQLGVRVIFSWPACVIAATVVAFPLMYKTAHGAFEQIDTNLLRAARTLGASEATVFWRVVLPLARPGIIAGTILAFARALGEFGATLMVAGNIPGQTQTIPVAIYFAVEAGDIKQASVWVLVILAISLTVLSALNFWSNSRREGREQREQREQRERREQGEQTPWINLRSSNKDIQQSRCKQFPSSDFFGSLALNSGASNHLAQGSLTLSPSASSAPSASPALFGENLDFNSPLPCFTSPGSDKSELVVDIQKQLRGFSLETSFTTGADALGLLGASGAGKSMLLQCIAGLETPSWGRIVLNGRVLFDSKKGINLPSSDRRIGFLFQNYALFPHLSVVQNIAFGLQHLPKPERDRRVNEQLARVQLQGLGTRYPHHLSGGQQQRVALARALAIQPEVLLLDEPFSALDTHLRSQLEKQLIETLSTYCGVTLFVTHNLEEAYRVCKNLLVLSEGKTAAYGSKENIFERPRTVRVAQLTGCKNFSRAQVISPQLVKSLDWGCTLRVIEPIPSLVYVGIRAHQLTFPNDPNQENTFLCWVVQTSETPHRMTLYLKLHNPPVNSQDYHLQAEVFKEMWAFLKDRPFPWYIHLDPLRLILMQE